VQGVFLRLQFTPQPSKEDCDAKSANVPAHFFVVQSSLLGWGVNCNLLTEILRNFDGNFDGSN